MSEDLQSLKQHPRVLDLYRSRLSLKQDGKRWRGPCPYHDDRHATNFDVFEDKGTLIFKCLSCGQAGSILDLVQKTDNVDFKGAVKIVREFCSEWGQDARKVEQTFRPLATETKQVKMYPEEAYKAYEEALTRAPEARKFLESRGISLEVAKRLRLGYRQDVGKLAGDANADIAGSGWIAFPTFENGMVTSIKYRSVVRKAFSRQPGMKTVLFNLEN